MSITIFITLTIKKARDYSIPSRKEGDIVMMTKKWRRKWEAVGEKPPFVFAPPMILLLKLIPLSGVYLLGRFFASVVDVFPGRRKKIALANLRLVFAATKNEEKIKMTHRE